MNRYVLLLGEAVFLVSLSTLVGAFGKECNNHKQTKREEVLLNEEGFLIENLHKAIENLLGHLGEKIEKSLYMLYFNNDPNEKEKADVHQYVEASKKRYFFPLSRDSKQNILTSNNYHSLIVGDYDPNIASRKKIQDIHEKTMKKSLPVPYFSTEDEKKEN